MRLDKNCLLSSSEEGLSRTPMSSASCKLFFCIFVVLFLFFGFFHFVIFFVLFIFFSVPCRDYSGHIVPLHESPFFYFVGFVFVYVA